MKPTRNSFRLRAPIRCVQRNQRILAAELLRRAVGREQLRIAEISVLEDVVAEQSVAIRDPMVDSPVVLLDVDLLRIGRDPVEHVPGRLGSGTYWSRIVVVIGFCRLAGMRLFGKRLRRSADPGPLRRR